MNDMSEYWKQIDIEVANTEMPPEYSNLEVWVNCGDCHKVNFLLR